MIGQEKISVILHAITGIIAGFLSYSLKNNYIALLSMIVILVFTSLGIQKIFKKDAKWVLSNGLIIYIFIWFISWVVFFNYGI